MAEEIRPTDIIRHLKSSYDIFLLLVIHRLGVAFSMGDIIRYFYGTSEGHRDRLKIHLERLKKKGLIHMRKVLRQKGYRYEIKLTEKGEAIVKLIKSLLLKPPAPS